MEHRESYLNAQDGLSIYTQAWWPPEPKAAALLVHGLGEHSARYGHVARMLNDAGYGLVGFDLPGHGKSSGPRGHIASYQLVSGLISQMLDETSKRNPGRPLFLYGHSLGGNLVLYYSLTCPTDLAGVIVTAPGLGTAAPVPVWKNLAGRFLYRVAPTVAMDNGLDISGLSRDPAVVAAYRADPLVHPKISARLGMDLLDHGAWLVANAATCPDIPLLVMQGGADRVVDATRTRRFVQSTQGDVTYKEWDGLYHELHNEPEQNEVLAYMLSWMDGKTAAAEHSRN